MRLRNRLINLMLTLVLPCMGMGLAAGALSGRALGRGDVDDATQWPWDVAKLTAALMFGVGLIAVLIPEVLLKVFLTNEDAGHGSPSGRLDSPASPSPATRCR